MSPEDQKAISRRHIHLWDDGTDSVPKEIFTANYINHQEPDVQDAGPRGLDAFEDLVRGYHQAFTNSKVEVLTQIAEGDLVATRWRITATNTGEYLTLAEPTNNRITWTGVLIDRFEDGRIAETWVSWDQYSFFQGLGLVNA